MPNLFAVKIPFFTLFFSSCYFNINEVYFGIDSNYELLELTNASFGMEAGASAVYLLVNEIYGVTTTGYVNGEIRYMPIKEAITQREVDLKQVSLYEQLGFCFGRVRTEFEAKTVPVSGKIHPWPDGDRGRTVTVKTVELLAPCWSVTSRVMLNVPGP